MAVTSERYDEQLIGKRIACLGDHRVFRYGDAAVIKFSQFDWCRRTTDRLGFYRHEVTFLRTVFGDYFAPTSVVHDGTGRRVGLVQPFIDGEPLGSDHLADERIRSQLQEIVARANPYRSPDQYLDLIGGGPQFFSAWFGNIFVTPDQHLVIIDASVLRAEDFAWWCRLPVSALIVLGNHLFTRRIKKFHSSQ